MIADRSQSHLSGWRRCGALGLALVLLASPALARSDKAKGPGGKGHDVVEDAVHDVLHGGDVDISVGVHFGVEETRLIHDYFAAHPTAPAALPPGIAKNVARGKPLPPGIAKKFLPQPLLSQLPVHGGHEYRIVGSDVLLVAVATGIVVDILAGVLH